MFKKIAAALHSFISAVSMACMAGLVLILFIHIVLRYVFNSGISWSEEVSSNILIPIFVFLGMAMGVEEKLHIDINILPSMTPARVRAVLEKSRDVLLIFIGGVFTWYSIKGIFLNIQYGNILPATGWNNAVQYMFIPVAGISIVLSSVMSLFGIDSGVKPLHRYLKNELHARSLEGDSLV